MAESMCWSGVMERNQLRPPTISLGFSPSITLCLLGTMCQPCGTVTNMCTSQAGWRGLLGRKSTLNSVMELCKLIFLLNYDHVFFFLCIVYTFLSYDKSFEPYYFTSQTTCMSINTCTCSKITPPCIHTCNKHKWKHSSQTQLHVFRFF